MKVIETIGQPELRNQLRKVFSKSNLSYISFISRHTWTPEKWYDAWEEMFVVASQELNTDVP